MQKVHTLNNRPFFWPVFKLIMERSQLKTVNMSCHWQHFFSLSSKSDNQRRLKWEPNAWMDEQEIMDCITAWVQWILPVKTVLEQNCSDRKTKICTGCIFHSYMQWYAQEQQCNTSRWLWTTTNFNHLHLLTAVQQNVRLGQYTNP